MGPVRPSVFEGKFRHRRVVVRNGDEPGGPVAVALLDDGVARMGRAGFDGVRIRMDVVVRRQADAAWVDDQLSAGGARHARHMRVPAGDQCRIDIAEPRIDLRLRGRAEVAGRNGLQEVFEIASCRVAIGYSR